MSGSEDDQEYTLEDQLEMEAVGVLKKQTRNVNRDYIYRKDILMQKVQEMKLDNIAGSKIPWIETLDITNSKPLELEDVHNDLARELAFYQQALYAVKEAKSRIKQAKVSFERPADYFAEMVKSDDHMTRIREKLLEEAESMKKSEEAKKMREMRKFGKKVQVQKLQERQKAKSDALDKISELKRKRKNNPGEGLDDEDFEIALEEDGKKKKGGVPNSKRQKKDEKYGHGGKKKYAKSNTRESTDDYKFDSARNKKSGFKKGGFKGKPGKPQKNIRPGKAKRSQTKNKSF